MIERLKKFFHSFVDDYANRSWVRLATKLVFTILVGGSIAFIIGNIALVIINNIENIVITIGAIFCFIWGISSLMTKSEPPKTAELPAPALEYDPITLESTYRLLRKTLCSIVGDVSEIIKVRKPTTLSQMDCPTHFDVISKAVIYHLLLTKTSEDFDALGASGILQNAIEQRLNNNEVDGITQTAYFYNGQVVPSIMIDNVREMGNYVQIDVAIASDYYCKYRERRIYENMNSSDSANVHDRDF